MKKISILLIGVSFVLAAQKTAIITIKGMTCPLCTSAIKHSLKHTKGVIKAKVILNTKTATVVFDENKTDTSKLLNAIKAVGYEGKIVEVK